MNKQSKLQKKQLEIIITNYPKDALNIYLAVYNITHIST